MRTGLYFYRLYMLFGVQLTNALCSESRVVSCTWQQTGPVSDDPRMWRTQPITDCECGRRHVLEKGVAS